MGGKAHIHEPPPQPGITKVLDWVVESIEVEELTIPGVGFLVAKDLIDRAEVGKEKYGTYLMTHNGRDALMDAYQEACDLLMYLGQCILERDNDLQLQLLFTQVEMILLQLRSRLNVPDAKSPKFESDR